MKKALIFLFISFFKVLIIRVIYHDYLCNIYMRLNVFLKKGRQSELSSKATAQAGSSTKLDPEDETSKILERTESAKLKGGSM